MKEFCLVPTTIAEKYMLNRPSSITTKAPSSPKTLATTTSATATSPSPATIKTAKVPLHANPPLHDIIKLSVPPSLRDYGLAFMSSLDNTSNISWDEQGNLLPPFSGLNVIDLINTLGTAKGKIPGEQSDLISLLLRYARIPQRALRTTQKKKLTGGSLWVAY